MKLTQALVLALLSINLTVQAATQIQHKTLQKGIQGQHTKQQTVLMEGDYAHMSSNRNADFYMLMNHKEGKIYNINVKQNKAIAIEIDAKTPPPMPAHMAQPPQQTDQPEPKTEFTKKGAGPKIAGYDTVHYQVMADGQLCSNEYLAPEALKVAHVKDFLNAMFTMSISRRKLMPFGMMAKDPCFVAHTNAQLETLDIGIPMRSVDKNGNVMQEILEIKTDVEVAADMFTLPKGIEVQTEAEMMRAMQERMKQMMQQRQQQTGNSQPNMSNPFQRSPLPPRQSNQEPQ